MNGILVKLLIASFAVICPLIAPYIYCSFRASQLCPEPLDPTSTDIPVLPSANLHSIRNFFQSALRSAKAPNTSMAWRSSGNTNKELVDNLFKHGLITSERVRDAMLKVGIHSFRRD